MNRYIRLDTMWSASEWLTTLSAEAKLVWIELLCYAKGHGRDGRVRSMHPEKAAHMWYVGAESIRQLLIAAESHGALALDGSDWVIVKWEEYQGDATSAERSKRYRENRKSVSSRVTPVSSLETEKEKDTREPPKPPKGGKMELPASLESIRSEIEELVAHRKHMGKAKAMTPEAIRRQLLRFERWGAEVAKRQIVECIERGWMAPLDPPQGAQAEPEEPEIPIENLEELKAAALRWKEANLGKADDA